MNVIGGVDRFFLSGDLVEVWEDPEQPFRCTPEAVERCLLAGNWVLAFNALVLASTPLQSE
jgi:hypothetical protein